MGARCRHCGLAITRAGLKDDRWIDGHSANCAEGLRHYGRTGPFPPLWRLHEPEVVVDTPTAIQELREIEKELR